MEDLITKYQPIINSVDKNLWNDYSKVLESCTTYLRSKNDIDVNLKVAATFVVKQLFLDDDDFNQKNIETIIDDFIVYYNAEYQNFMNKFALVSDQFSADLDFYYFYIKTQEASTTTFDAIN